MEPSACGYAALANLLVLHMVLQSVCLSLHLYGLACLRIYCGADRIPEAEWKNHEKALEALHVLGKSVAHSVDRGSGAKMLCTVSESHMLLYSDPFFGCLHGGVYRLSDHERCRVGNRTILRLCVRRNDSKLCHYAYPSARISGKRGEITREQREA